MGSTAQLKVFGPFFQTGELVTAPQLYHYAAGTVSTLLDAYADRAKGTTVAQPLLGDANGIAWAYFDGLYKIVVLTSDGEELFTWDNFDATEGQHRLEGSTTWDPTSMLPGQSQTSPPITVTGAAFSDFVIVAAPYDLQGVLAMGYVSAANTVKIKLWRDLADLQATATYDPGNLVDGAGETSAGITVTGAALGDTVLVYAPYDLQGLTVTGYVSAANTVKIRVQNESAATVDLASGTWRVVVIPQGAAIDLANGSWKVRVLQQ